MGKPGSKDHGDGTAADGTAGTPAPTVQSGTTDPDLRALLIEVKHELAALRVELNSAVLQRHESSNPPEYSDRGTADQLSRLALFDEMMGLRAELAQTRVHAEMAEASSEPARLRRALNAAQLRAGEPDAVAALMASRSWRVGHAVLTPLRVGRRLWRR